MREAFRGPGPWPRFRPEWRTDTVVAMARQTADTREFSALPILADALQDAGCDDDHLLDHLRHKGWHTAGCWALDLIEG